MDKGKPVEPSDEKVTSEVEKQEEDGVDDAEKNEPSKDNLRRVGMKRSFDVAFLTGSDATTRSTVTTTTTGGNSVPEEEEEHKSAFSRYVKRFVDGCFFAQMSPRCRRQQFHSHFHCFVFFVL